MNRPPCPCIIIFVPHPGMTDSHAQSLPCFSLTMGPDIPSAGERVNGGVGYQRFKANPPSKFLLPCSSLHRLHKHGPIPFPCVRCFRLTGDRELSLLTCVSLDSFSLPGLVPVSSERDSLQNIHVTNRIWKRVELTASISCSTTSPSDIRHSSLFQRCFAVILPSRSS